MDIGLYQILARKTAIYPNIGGNWQYPMIGLTGELGELANKLKKAIRDDNALITDKKRMECTDELGDLFWYLVMLCDELNIDPNYVLMNNLAKLEERRKSNSLHDNKNRKPEIVS